MDEYWGGVFSLCCSTTGVAVNFVDNWRCWRQWEDSTCRDIDSVRKVHEFHSNFPSRVPSKLSTTIELSFRLDRGKLRITSTPCSTEGWFWNKQVVNFSYSYSYRAFNYSCTYESKLIIIKGGINIESRYLAQLS